MDIDTEAEDFDEKSLISEIKSVTGPETASVEVEDEETLAIDEMTVYFSEVPEDDEEAIPMSFKDASAYVEEKGFEEPDPAAYGVWVPGIPVIAENLLDKINTADTLLDAVPCFSKVVAYRINGAHSCNYYSSHEYFFLPLYCRELPK